MKLIKTALLTLVCGFSVIMAPDLGQASGKQSESVLTAFSAEQAGDSVVMLLLEGRRLAEPAEVCQNGESLSMILEGVKFPALKYERALETPLVPYLTAEQTDNGTVLTLHCEAPLRIDAVRGVGSGNLKIRLKRLDRKEREPLDAVLKDSPEPLLPVRKITLNLKDSDLHDIFRILGAVADLNIVVDSSVPVTSRMTLTFADAPFSEVFHYILRSQNLEWRRVGGTILIGAKNSLGLLSGRMVTKSYRISYAEAEKIAPLLKEMAELLSPANRILVDERQSLLIVTGTVLQQERTRAALEILDAPQRQVMLKARIIEVNDDASDQLETAINAVYDWWWASYQSGSLSAGAAYSKTSPSERPGLPNLGTADKLPGSIGNGIVNLAGTAARLLDVRLNALVEEKKARVLADPTVTVLDGCKATVKLVDKLKYVSRRDDANNPTYDDEEVGPSLEVVPRIARNGMITVGVSLATGEVIQWIRGSQGEQVPQVNTRSVDTTVTVRDSEPFVIGGLYKDTKSRVRSGVPVLQNLPLLGWLFQYKSYRKTRSQVVMVVIPTVLGVPDSPSETNGL